MLPVRSRRLILPGALVQQCLLGSCSGFWSFGPFVEELLGSGYSGSCMHVFQAVGLHVALPLSAIDSRAKKDKHNTKRSFRGYLAPESENSGG